MADDNFLVGVTGSAGEGVRKLMRLLQGAGKVPYAEPSGNFEQRRGRARKELEEQGITAEQRQAYTPGISEGLYEGIEPFSYAHGTPTDIIRHGLLNITKNRSAVSGDPREDAWRAYLGMPQKHNTFGISDYRPSKSKDPNKVYLKLNQYWPEQRRVTDDVNRITKKFYPKDPSGDDVFLKYWGKSGRYREVDWNPGVMGVHARGSDVDEQGRPYLSYYDKWNLEGNPVEGEEGRFGKPFELYDRLYYDPKTKEIYWDGPPPVAPQALKSMQPKKKK
jgi:hypothetical protein